VRDPHDVGLHRAARDGADSGEVLLADALQRLSDREPVYAIDMCGQRIDCGTRSGLVEAMLEVASRDPELAPTVMRWREPKIRR
jgi:UTP--glucose-1-phosphate uridylyltransferase